MPTCPDVWVQSIGVISIHRPSRTTSLSVDWEISFYISFIFFICFFFGLLLKKLVQPWPPPFEDDLFAVAIVASLHTFTRALAQYYYKTVAPKVPIIIKH